jgi:hypothetical protein
MNLQGASAIPARAPAAALLAAVGLRRPPPAAAYASEWEPQGGILATRLHGRPTARQVVQWEAGLRAALAAAGTAPLRLLVDLRGYEAGEVSWEIHRRQREVVPRVLSELGHRGSPGLAGPAAGAAGATPARVRAVAHGHHDRDKMALHEAALSSASERYFSDPVEALEWLRAR